MDWQSVRLNHHGVAGYGSPFQGLSSVLIYSLGVAQGWYGVAPLGAKRFIESRRG